MNKTDKNQPTQPSAGCVRAAEAIVDKQVEQDILHGRNTIVETDTMASIIHRETQHDWKSNPAVRELVEAVDNVMTYNLGGSARWTNLQAALEPFKENTDETKD